ncbi:MAG: serine/threonine protein kinase, partial [Myxococcales bacterium]|nr:serine/threonine protein kinase [Myxococcales bacterium]
MKPGDRIGTYILVAPVARGGMGEVWRARHHTLNRFVAIKFIRTDARDAPGLRLAFEHEVRNLARLHAPQTVQVIDSGVHDDHPYMVTEFLEGEDLRQRLRQDAHLRPTEAVWIAIEVLKSLSEAHALGIVHRDLKPANVFLQRLAGGGGERYAVKVLDFGIAKVLHPEGDDPDFTLWPGAAVKGSPRYMAPEQVKGHGVTPASDLYSLGALLYRTLAGEPVFRGEKEAVLEAQVKRDPEPLGARAPLLGVPERLDAVVMQCLAKDPARRPASADHLRETLEALLPELGETDALMELDGSVTMSGPLPAAVAAARAQAPSDAAAPLDPFAATQAFSADDVSASVN